MYNRYYLGQGFSTFFIRVPPTQFENIYVPFDHFFAFFLIINNV